MQKDLPGCILDIGVYKGGSLITWANLVETFFPGDRFKMVYGFDHFKGLEDFCDDDGKEDNSRGQGKIKGGWKAPAEIARTLMQLFNEDTICPNIDRV